MEKPRRKRGEIIFYYEEKDIEPVSSPLSGEGSRESPA